MVQQWVEFGVNLRLSDPREITDQQTALASLSTWPLPRSGSGRERRQAGRFQLRLMQVLSGVLIQKDVHNGLCRITFAVSGNDDEAVRLCR